MRSGEVRVFGLVAPTHVIEDIGMDVPHGREVTIPPDKAARSRDLYKAISQKCIFRMPDAPPPVHVAPVTMIRDDVLQERIAFLEAKIKQLEDENAHLRASLRAALSQQGQLDAIFTAIQNVRIPEVVYASGQPAMASKQELADGTAPQFIPTEIAPKGAETRIDVVQNEVANRDISDAAARLRQMRKGAG